MTRSDYWSKLEEEARREGRPFKRHAHAVKRFYIRDTENNPVSPADPAFHWERLAECCDLLASKKPNRQIRAVLENGQVVYVKPLSPERKAARTQLAEYRKLVEDYRKAYPRVAEWWIWRNELLSKPVMPSVPNDVEVSFREPEMPIRIKNVRLSYPRVGPTLKELGYDLTEVTRQFVRESERRKEDEIRRMLGLWVSELEPTVAYGPCSIPWGLHPAGHAVMGQKMKMTVPSIWCPEELRND